MGRLARKKQHKGDKPLKEKYRLRRKTKDLDQIQTDMLPGKSDELLKQDVDLDKPGAAQHYCLHCAWVYPCTEPHVSVFFFTPTTAVTGDATGTGHQKLIWQTR